MNSALYLFAYNVAWQKYVFWRTKYGRPVSKYTASSSLKQRGNLDSTSQLH